MGALASIIKNIGRVCAELGTELIDVLLQTGKFVIFVARLVRVVSSRGVPIGIFLQTLAWMIRHSMLLAGVIGVFTGVVLVLQIEIGSGRMLAINMTPSIVALGLTRELIPVLSGLIVCTSLSARIAAELGSMVQTQQIDALKCMGIDLWWYLVAPRVLAMLILVPLLVLIGDSLGIFGGYLTSVYAMGGSPYYYLAQVDSMLEYSDVLSGMVKGIAFAAFSSILGCYYGLKNCPSALQVGSNVTRTVQMTSLTILYVNCVLTAIFYSWWS